jgi:hypothetical protein
MPVKKAVTSALALGFALVLSFPAVARADKNSAENSARTAAQKHNLKQSRRDMKRMQKQPKKMRQSAPGKKSH